MRQTRAIELGTGLFVLLGFAALFFLVTQISSRQFGWDAPVMNHLRPFSTS